MAATNKCMAWKSKSRARGNAKGQHCHSPPFGGARPHDISLHDPELYYFLTLLAGIAALLAVIYEFPRRKPGRWKRAAALLRDRSLPTGEKHVGEKIDESPRPAGEQEGLASFPSEPITVGGTIRARLFHVLIEGEAKRKHLGRGPRICESVDVPPKEQASRGDKHFGIFGRAPPAKGRGKRP
jgi:hypothetical protein